uniref:Na/Pi symporter n=1 Tax=Roseihalotalea indica TaxID=2867963 RepID=A0AA49GJ37_9BACT|nr:Na/Pi symporter [Tunicatimonas sp. TK19036]
MVTTVDLWKMMAGLGLFLFAMFQMEEAITALAGRSFKLFLKTSTQHVLTGLMSGVLITAIVQSSSMVSLLLLAFVGAGILSMKRALPVIFGSNLGTTVTGWVVATLGFKLPIGNIALPLVGIGGLMLFFFSAKPRYFNMGRFLLSFGLIFLGLEYLKESMESLALAMDLGQFSHYGLSVFLGIGVVLTALIQSSSAIMVMALSALHTELLTLPAAIAIVIGSNVGTTITVFLGALGDAPAKKQVAFAHFLFNIVTAAVAFSMLPLLLKLITEVVRLQDPLMALVGFHTLFNLLGVLLFLPFTRPLAHLLERLFVAKKVVVNQYLHLVTVQVPEAALEALRKETHRLLCFSLYLNLKALHVSDDKLNQYLVQTEAFSTGVVRRQSYEKGYRMMKQWEGEMLRYNAELQKQVLPPEESAQLSRLLRVVHSSMHSVKGLKDIEHNILDFESQTKAYYLRLLRRIQKSSQQFYEALLEIVLADGREVSFDELSALMVMIQHSYELLLSDIYQTIDKKSLDEVSLSTFFNVNRELYSSHKAMLLAASDLLGFPSEGTIPLVAA